MSPLTRKPDLKCEIKGCIDVMLVLRMLNSLTFWIFKVNQRPPFFDIEVYMANITSIVLSTREVITNSVLSCFFFTQPCHLHAATNRDLLY